MKRFQADLIGPSIADPLALRAASACTVPRQHWSRSAQIQLPCSRHCHQTSLTVHAAREVVTDQAVPEGHKGLHGFLYGEQGAEVHENSLQPDSLREVCNTAAECPLAVLGPQALMFRDSLLQEEDTGATAVEVERYVKERLGENRAGVYAISDSSNVVQYVGYARSILSAVKVSQLTEPPPSAQAPQLRMRNSAQSSLRRLISWLLARKGAARYRHECYLLASWPAGADCRLTRKPGSRNSLPYLRGMQQIETCGRCA